MEPNPRKLERKHGPTYTLVVDLGTPGRGENAFLRSGSSSVVLCHNSLGKPIQSDSELSTHCFTHLFL